MTLAGESLNLVERTRNVVGLVEHPGFTLSRFVFVWVPWRRLQELQRFPPATPPRHAPDERSRSGIAVVILDHSCASGVETDACEVLNVLGHEKRARFQDEHSQGPAAVNLLGTLRTEHARSNDDRIELNAAIIRGFILRVADVPTQDVPRKRRVLNGRWLCGLLRAIDHVAVTAINGR